MNRYMLRKAANPHRIWNDEACTRCTFPIRNREVAVKVSSLTPQAEGLYHKTCFRSLHDSCQEI
jgi:hypothetical protein